MAGGDRKNADSILLTALASGKSIQACAQMAEVSEATVYRRLRSTKFKRRLIRARGQMLTRSLNLLADGSASAAIVLRKLLKASGEKVRLAAAKAILEQVAKMRESVEMAEQIAELQRRMDASDNMKVKR